ncbi:MAG: hypothetical protein IANPNBLG_01905 [Bryobacteraceae bacterium]|nr:hypothetical protein [Bryobacteraceae bacterium]
MQKTTIGLFKTAEHVEEVVRDIEALGFTRNGVGAIKEPGVFEPNGVMSFPRLEYEVELGRTLSRLGAKKEETEAYIGGLRHGGALVFATDEDEKKVDAAADVMNRHGAVDIEESASAAPHLPRLPHESLRQTQDAVLTGRSRQSGSGARFFTW